MFPKPVSTLHFSTISTGSTVRVMEFYLYISGVCCDCYCFHNFHWNVGRPPKISIEVRSRNAYADLIIDTETGPVISETDLWALPLGKWQFLLILWYKQILIFLFAHYCIIKFSLGQRLAYQEIGCQLIDACFPVSFCSTNFILLPFEGCWRRKSLISQRRTFGPNWHLRSPNFGFKIPKR